MNRFILFLGLLFCSHLPILAQTKGVASNSKSKIDSLSRLFNAAKDDAAKIKVMVNTPNDANEYFEQFTPIINLLKEALNIAQKIDDKKSIVILLSKVAALEMYAKGDEATAFQIYMQALKYAEVDKNYEACAKIYDRLGVISQHQNFKAEMYKYLFKSVEYAEKSATIFFNPYQNLKIMFLEDGKINEALAISQKFIKYVNDRKSTNVDKVFAYGSLLEVLNKLPSKKQELNLINKKMDTLLVKIKNTDIHFSYIHDIALACYESKKYDLAIFYSNQVLKKSDKNKQIEIVKELSAKLISQIYENQKRYKESLQYYKLYTEIYQRSKSNQISLESGRKVIRAEGERNLLLKQKEIDKERFYRNISFTIAGFILLLAIISFYFYQRLQSQKTQLHLLNTTKDKLFTILSHDLRSPIALIENNLMLIDWGALSKKEFAETTQKLAIKVRNIRNLLDNLLTWALTQSNAMKPKSEIINIIQIIEEEIEILSTLTQSKNIQISTNFQYQTSLLIDKNHLRFISRNLLHNAIKFTNAGGKVQINVLENKDDVSIEIIDNGVGMTDNTLASLFQMNSSDFTIGTNGERGIGIGLVLVKELIELNNGNIIVNSKHNEGTYFKITFKNKIKV